jgi:hypothetical protein
MGSYLRLTPALRDVLACLSATETEVWGLLLSSRSGRPTGTVYPILERLERERFVQSRWETDADRTGPRRRLYSLTTEGREWAAVRLARSDANNGGAR